MKPVEKLLAEFKCPKCRGTDAVAREGTLGERIPLVGAGRYVFISCALCGYTEIYNQKILVKAEDRDRVENAVRESSSSIQ